MKKVIVVIMDGLPDGPAGKDSLKEAEKYSLNFLAQNGFCGIVTNNLDEHPDSGISHFALFGYDRSEYPGRGFLEALGISLKPMPETVYLRANFGTVKEEQRKDIVPENPKTLLPPRLVVLDRRCGRDYSGIIEMTESIREINIDGVKVRFHKSLGHRGVVTISAVGVSPAVTNSDPGFVGKDVMEITPLVPEAEMTASTLNKWQYETYRILSRHPQNRYRKIPANFILLRGASKYSIVKGFREKHGLRGAVIAASPVIKGLGRALEMDVVEVSGANGTTNTNLRDKTLAALEAVKTHDIVILHIKGTDVAAHDKSYFAKRSFIERVDREVFRRLLEYIDINNTVIAVTSDHPTSPVDGEHYGGDMPYLIFGKNIKSNGVDRFDIQSCNLGSKITIDEFMERLIGFLS